MLQAKPFFGRHEWLYFIYSCSPPAQIQCAAVKRRLVMLGEIWGEWTEGRLYLCFGVLFYTCGIKKWFRRYTSQEKVGKHWFDLFPTNRSYCPPPPGPLQFAYKANTSVDDSINMALNFILEHLDSPGTYGMTLFVDFTYIFNNILPDLLQVKLSHLSPSEAGLLTSWRTGSTM